MDGNKLRIASLNVRGIKNPEKRIKLFKWFKLKNYDIVCLQETFVTKDIIDNINKDWDGIILHNLSNSSYAKGTSVLIKPGLNIDIVKTKVESQIRGIIVNMKCYDC